MAKRTTPRNKKDDRDDIQMWLGGRFVALEAFILDAAIGRSVTSRPQVEFFATVGLRRTFDASWKRRNR